MSDEKAPEGHPLAPWLPPIVAEEEVRDEPPPDVEVKRPLSPFAGLGSVPKWIKIK